METILSLFKSYFVLMLLLLMLSYLAPKDSYKKYFQFFIGAWMCVLLLKPVFGWFDQGEEIVYSGTDEILEEISGLEEWQGEEVNLFELFFVDSQTDGGQEVGEE